MKKINQSFKILIFFLFGILLFVPLISAVYTESLTYSSKYNRAIGQGVFSTGESLRIDESMCQQGTDFIIQINPLECIPSPVRSDLLEEENVNVFCKLTAIKINPFIEVTDVDGIRFDREYPREVLNIGYQPAQAALGYTGDNLDGSLINNNFGYVVITLRRQPNESALTNCEKAAFGLSEVCWVEGNITATLRYDVRNSFGLGNAEFYLPVMNDKEWEDNYLYYGFWDGRGYLRAESVTEDSAILSIYSASSVARPSGKGGFDYRLARYASNIKLGIGDSSRKVFLPGINPCLGNLQLTLHGIERPDTAVMFKVNGDYVEVRKDGKFLDERCTVIDIFKTGLSSQVKIRCKEKKQKVYTLSLSPQVNLSLDGGNPKEYSIGDFLYGYTDSKGQYQKVYLGYIGSDGNEEDLNDLYVILVSLPISENIKKNSLDEEELYFIASYAEAKDGFLSNLGVNTVRFFKWAITGESFKVVPYKNKKTGAISEGIEFADKKVALRGFAVGNYLDVVQSDEELYQSYYDSAIEDFEKVIDSYSNEREYESDIQDFGERALIEEIYLAESVKEMRTVLELCKKFNEEYPNSQARIGICDSNILLSNNKASIVEVTINDITNRISFLGVKEPSLEEYNAEVVVKGPNGRTERYNLRKNKQIPLIGFRTEEDTQKLDSGEYILLESLDTGSAQITFAVGKTTTNNKGDKEITVSTKSEKLNLNVQRPDIGDYSFTLVDTTLASVAKVSIDSNIERAISNSSFKFKIGIEKRAIKLAPDKTKEKLRELEKRIDDLTKISSTLDSINRGMKFACGATGAGLVVKNLIANRNGKAIAREKVMAGTGGWNEKCQEDYNSGLYKYKSVEDCLLDNAEEIEKEVEDMANIISQQNNKIRELEATYTKDGKLNEKLFMVSYSNHVYSSVDSSLSKMDRNSLISLTESLHKDSLSPDEIMEMSEEKMIELNRQKIQSILNNRGTSESKYGTDYLVSEGAFTVNELKEIELYATYLNKNSGDIEASSRLSSAMSKVGINSDKYLNALETAKTLGGVNPSHIVYIELKDENAVKYDYRGNTKGNTKTNLPDTIPKDTPILITTIPAIEKGNLVFVLEKSKGSGVYPIDKVYYTDGTEFTDKEILSKLRREVTIVKRDSLYKNRYLSSYGSAKTGPLIKFFESSSHSCRPALVPLDTHNGWYAGMKSAEMPYYSDSGRIEMFYLCNVGDNGIEEFSVSGFGDDFCTLLTAAGLSSSQFSQLEGKSIQDYFDLAVRSIAQAQQTCMRGISPGSSVNINGNSLNIGEPPSEDFGFRCTDFMSVKDCNLLFNLCDPVICPSSRCDLGGKYPVKNVISSGIIGSIFLCLPNWKVTGGDVYIPVCLTGVQAGIDNFISVQKAYSECLEKSLETGETIGICDEIHSIYLCSFFWEQATPIIKYFGSHLLERILGQKSQGGGEYKGFASALKNSQNTVDYLKNYYAKESYRAFQVRSMDTVGTKACGRFVSAVYADSGSFISNLIAPDSPSQFTGKFEEIPLTTSTNPPTSHYKVWYHIYAGKDSGAYYRVYLRGSASNYYMDNVQRRVVNSSYIPKGGYADATIDFTAPAGYRELCIEVNGVEECGFKEVSTSFSVNYLSDLFLKDQVKKKNIDSEEDCRSGTASIYSLLDLNVLSAAENLINPDLYAQGITRVCSTHNPGLGPEISSSDSEDLRWQKVGHCGDERVGCWIDTESVRKAIKNLNLEEDAIESIKDETLSYLSEDYFTQKEFEAKKKDIQSEDDPLKRIDLIDSIFEIDKIFFNNHKAYLFFWRGKSYAQLAMNNFGKCATNGNTKCEGTTHFVCEDNKWVNKGQVNGKCGYVEDSTTTSGGDSWFNIKYTSPHLLPSDKNILTLDDRCYRYFNSKWQFAISCDPTVAWFNVDVLGNEYTNPVSKRSKEIITSLQNYNGDYVGGLKVLIDKTMEDRNAKLSEKTFKVSSMDEEGLFTVKFKDVNYEPMKKIYYKYENGEWYWELDKMFEGGGVRHSVSNVAPGFNNLQKAIVLALEGKTFYDGAAILFNPTSKDIQERYFVGGSSTTSVATSLEANLQKRDLDKVTKLMKDLSSSVYASTFKCYCGKECENYAKWIFEAANSNNIPDELLLLAIMIQESSCKAVKSSDGGDIGLMQINVLHCGTKGLSSNSGNCISTLLNDNEKNIKIGAQILKEAYSPSSRVYTCVMPVETYFGWEYALRGYNGWNTDCSKGDIHYVRNVKEKYFELVRLYDGGTPTTPTTPSTPTTPTTPTTPSTPSTSDVYKHMMFSPINPHSSVVFYRYNNVWQWNVYTKSISDSSWESVPLDSSWESVPSYTIKGGSYDGKTLNDKNQELILKLNGKNYEEGLKILKEFGLITLDGDEIRIPSIPSTDCDYEKINPPCTSYKDVQLSMFSTVERKLFLAVKNCEECGDGLSNLCDRDECKAIALKLNKNCVHTNLVLGYGKCEEKSSTTPTTPSTPTTPTTPTTPSTPTTPTTPTTPSTLSPIRQKVLTSAQELDGTIVPEVYNNNCGVAANYIYQHASAGLSRCIYSTKKGTEYSIFLRDGTTAKVGIGSQKDNAGRIIWVTADSCTYSSDTLTYSDLLKSLVPGDRIDIVYNEDSPHSVVFINWVKGNEYIIANVSDWNGKTLIKNQKDRVGTVCTEKDLYWYAPRCKIYQYTQYDLRVDRHPIYRVWNPVPI